MKNRQSAFTSSEIYHLIKSGRGKNDIFSAPALTYIETKNIETKLGRSINTGELYTKPVIWGNLMEYILWERFLPLNYKLVSKDTRSHKSKEFSKIWKGTPDFEVMVDGIPTMISETKSYQLLKFAKYTDMLMAQDLERFKTDFPQEYWQIVSNCIINDVPIGEAISFMPYKEDLELIREDIEKTDLLEKVEIMPWNARFIVESDIDDLPYLKKGGYFKNVTKFMFEIPKSDVDYLTERVRLAKELLIKI